MTEAFTVITIFTIIYALFEIKSSKDRVKQMKTVLSNVTLVGAISLLIHPIIYLDLIRNYFLRAGAGFAYTGFGSVQWDPWAVIFSLPYLKITSSSRNLELVYGNNPVLALAIFLIFIFLIKYLKSRDRNVILGSLFTVLIIYLINPGYPMWKASVLIQPTLLMGLAPTLFTGIKLKKLRIIVTGLYAFLILITTYTLLNNYSKYSIKVYAQDFGDTSKLNARWEVDKNFALVTPTPNSFYFFLGMNRPSFYANSTWGPEFYGNLEYLPIALYYSCKIETQQVCKLIKTYRPNIIEGKLLFINKNLGSILDGNNRVDFAKLDDLLETEFGLKHTHTE
jgi:hypothetical protein